MASSFETIDYRMRPAKGVERRMMAEAFLRLRAFGSVESYRYVGMGSVYFSDFSLFNSICGFESMVSIEGEPDLVKQARFKFNVPLGNINLLFGNTNDVLPTLPWDLRSVVWLDYDGVLVGDVLTDVKFLGGRMSSGSILSLSINANLNDEEDGKKSRLEVLRERLGSPGKIPAKIASENILKPESVFQAYRDILAQELQDGLNDRNAGRPPGQKLVKEQIYFFKYKDGAQMLTIGWVLFEEGQRSNFNQCGFDTLPFCRASETPFLISPPLLTSAEIREIDRCDETGVFRLLTDLPFPPPQVQKYQDLRRYWPLGKGAEMA
jgi:hypothetical protein